MKYDVLTYLKDCYSFLGDPAIKDAIDEIERLNSIIELKDREIAKLDYFVNSIGMSSAFEEFLAK